MRVVNLSNHPFVNERPVRRMTVLLWLVAAVLIALNIFNYWTYWLDSAEMRGDLGEIRQTVEENTKTYEELRKEVSSVDLDELNEKTVFLNQLIEFRTFPWSQLFDDLEEVLEPNYDIQLRSVQPQQKKREIQSATKNTSRRRDRQQERDVKVKTSPEPPQSKEVRLQLRGVSKSSEAIYSLVEMLFSHPAFLEPDLHSEATDDTSRLTTFDISVLYLTHINKETGEEAGEDLLADQVTNADQTTEQTDEDQTLESPAQATAELSLPDAAVVNRNTRASSSTTDESARPVVTTNTRESPPRQVNTPPRQVVPRQVPNTPRKPSVQGNTVQGNTVQGNTVQGNTVQGNAVQGNAVQRNTAQRNTAQRNLRRAPTPTQPSRSTPPRTLRPRPVPPPPQQPTPPQPNFNNEVASGTPRLNGGN